MNALTVDVEDWFHVCGVDLRKEFVPTQHRVRHNIDCILALLQEYSVVATFFVLGSVAEQYPDLVPTITAAGHEVASHGYSHQLASHLGPSKFREEVQRTGEILERQSGQKPLGFRAPQWSISCGSTPWAFGILREEGYRYDSSCTPLPLIGEPRSSRFPFIIETVAGALLEIPPMVTPSFLGNLPTGGGWGFRFFPLKMVSGTIEKMNKCGNPAIIYIHPRDVDPFGPRLRLSPLKSFASYGTRTSAAGRLRYLLGRYRFGTLKQLVDTWHSA